METNGKGLLAALNIPNKCVMSAMQHVRSRVTENGIDEANYYIHTISGLNKDYTDVSRALHVAQHLCEIAIKTDSFDPATEIQAGEDRHDAIIKAMPWITAKADAIAVSDPQVAVVAGIDMKVSVNKDGKIKKGGKQVLAAELYKKYVKDAAVPLDNQGFISVLVKELGMSKAGATTYNYNLKKEFGGQITKR